MENLLTLPLGDSDLEGYDLDQLRREEEEYDKMFPALSSYPLFNAAPYGQDIVGKKQACRTKFDSSKSKLENWVSFNCRRKLRRHLLCKSPSMSQRGSAPPVCLAASEETKKAWTSPCQRDPR